MFELSDGYLVGGMLQDPVDDTWGILVLKLAKGNGAVLSKTLYKFDATGSILHLAGGSSFTANQVNIGSRMTSSRYPSTGMKSGMRSIGLSA